MHSKSYIITVLLVASLVTLTGCTLPWKKKAPVAVPVNNQTASSTPSSNNNESGGGEINKFKNIEELQAFLIQHTSTDNPTMLNGGGVRTSLAPMVATGGATNAVAAVRSESSAGQSTSDYSKTNIQVEGVDEADIMKTDGNYVYLLDYSDLYIIKAKPASDAGVITKITFKSRPQEFYISGDRLVIFGYDDQIYNSKTYQSFKRQSQYTYVKVFDISDPKNPKQIRDLNLEGNYSDSRLVGDYLYMVTNNYQNYLPGEPLLPRVLDGGQVLAEKCNLSDKCFEPNIYYFNIPYQSYNFTSITAVNVKNANEAIAGDIYLLSGNQNLYVSPNNIYITYTEYLNESDVEREVVINLIKPLLSADNQAKITKIEAADSFILSDTEKKNKIYNIVQGYLVNLSNSQQDTLQKQIDDTLKQTLEARAKEMEKTVIHKIAFKGSSLEYKTSGSVSGHVLNQYSMDENNGYFRIATTRSQTWSRLQDATKDSYNNVYVLDQNLKTVGLLENLASGERIYAARFMGDRAYLVTYKQTDPLFAIDLKTPTAPRVLGELKIPGYSTYLHPYTENLLLGFGRDTDVSASGVITNKGLKLGLFDVSDASNPKELDSFVTGDKFSDSIALSDPKAFLASYTKNLVSLPVTLKSGQYGEKTEFSGALVFGVSDAKINLRGRIDHSDNGNYNKQDYWGGIGYFDNSVKRSLYIDDALYTFSNKFLKINSLKSSGEDLSLIKSIDLLPNSGKDFEITPMPAVSSGSGETGSATSVAPAVVTPPNLNGVVMPVSAIPGVPTSSVGTLTPTSSN